MCSRIPAISLLLALSVFARPNFAQTPGANNIASLAQHRLGHLRHGINLSEWFAQAGDAKNYTKSYFDTRTTEQDIALIKSMGFDHVRLSVNPAPMFRRGQADRLPAEYLGYLDAAVKMILNHGLAIEMDIHPESDFKQKLATDDGAVEQFADFWRALARHYSDLDPEMVFFEILNEPEVRDRYRWAGIQARLAAAIRDGAPHHTILATGARWSDDDDLLASEPLHDPNVIYVFHFYEPHVFTHQGANWSTNYYHYLNELPYPSDLESAQRAANQVPDPVNRLGVLRYGMDRWNMARIDAEIASVADWSKRWNVPVVCNEFGVYRKTSIPKDRAAWISDVRTSLEKHGMGWAMWDYSGGFGVVTRQADPQGQTVSIPDEITVRALGRAMPNSQK
ncbi:MAG: cellulase family glycosylhydrolase [Candidatus Acidiferrum sp.]